MTVLRTDDARRLLNAAARIDTHLAEVDTNLLRRWRDMFRDDIDLVLRARNNIVYCDPISDRNLAAAAHMAERIAQLADDGTAAVRAQATDRDPPADDPRGNRG